MVMSGGGHPSPCAPPPSPALPPPPLTPGAAAGHGGGGAVAAAPAGSGADREWADGGRRPVGDVCVSGGRRRRCGWGWCCGGGGAVLAGRGASFPVPSPTVTRVSTSTPPRRRRNGFSRLCGGRWRTTVLGRRPVCEGCRYCCRWGCGSRLVWCWRLAPRPRWWRRRLGRGLLRPLVSRGTLEERPARGLRPPQFGRHAGGLTASTVGREPGHAVWHLP